MFLLMTFLCTSTFVFRNTEAKVSGCPSRATLVAERYPKAITSPNYPGKYGIFNTRLTCEWLISASDAYDDVVIQIKFHNSSLEPATGCLRDAVNIYDGPRDFYRPLTTVCGKVWPSNTITSTQRDVLTTFTTDFRNNDFYGFKLYYWVAKKPVMIVRPLEWNHVNFILLAIAVFILSAFLVSLSGLYCRSKCSPDWREKGQ